MPKAPRCMCGQCGSCRSRASMRRKREKWNSEERMPWPAEYHTLRLASCYGQYFGESAKVAKPPHYASQE